MIVSELTDKELTNELRCLRKDLKPVLNERILSLLEETETRLNRGVSTAREPLKKGQQQGKRIKKKQLVGKYYYK